MARWVSDNANTVSLVDALTPFEPWSQRNTAEQNRKRASKRAQPGGTSPP